MKRTFTIALATLLSVAFALEDQGARFPRMLPATITTQRAPFERVSRNHAELENVDDTHTS